MTRTPEAQAAYERALRKERTEEAFPTMVHPAVKAERRYPSAQLADPFKRAIDRKWEHDHRERFEPPYLLPGVYTLISHGEAGYEIRDAGGRLVLKDEYATQPWKGRDT